MCEALLLDTKNDLENRRLKHDYVIALVEFTILSPDYFYVIYLLIVSIKSCIGHNLENLL